MGDKARQVLRSPRAYIGLVLLCNRPLWRVLHQLLDIGGDVDFVATYGLKALHFLGTDIGSVCLAMVGLGFIFHSAYRTPRKLLSEPDVEPSRVQEIGRKSIELADEILAFQRENSFDEQQHVAIRFAGGWVALRTTLKEMNCSLLNERPHESYDRKFGVIAGYLYLIGHLLEDGNVNEARAVSQRIVPAVAKLAESLEHPEPLSTEAKMPQ